MTGPIDCLIVGGGPAGLTAAIYAARFRLSVQVVDAGGGRAAMIPCTRNHAGFPGGIPGAELLARMRAQALRFGASIDHGSVRSIARQGEDFAVRSEAGDVTARALILATGVTNRRPPMDDAIHDSALAAGRLRYCGVCDGFEVSDQSVALIGTGDHGTREALFLRAYTRRVSLIAPQGRHTLSDEDRGALEAGDIATVDGPAEDFRLERDGLSFACAAGRLNFEAVYPALGSEVHSDLARALGADIADEGCVKVDAHQRTSVAGLYAAGDVVAGLDQISHAMGQAGIAATTMRNDLAARRPLRR